MNRDIQPAHCTTRKIHSRLSSCSPLFPKQLPLKGHKGCAIDSALRAVYFRHKEVTSSINLLTYPDGYWCTLLFKQLIRRPLYPTVNITYNIRCIKLRSLSSDTRNKLDRVRHVKGSTSYLQVSLSPRVVTSISHHTIFNHSPIQCLLHFLSNTLTAE